MTRYTISLPIKEIEIKTIKNITIKTIRVSKIEKKKRPNEIIFDEDLEQLDLSGTAKSNIIWHNHLGNNLIILNLLNIQLWYDSAILFLWEIEKIYVHTKNSTNMFIAFLFVIAKHLKQTNAHQKLDG